MKKNNEWGAKQHGSIQLRTQLQNGTVLYIFNETYPYTVQYNFTICFDHSKDNECMKMQYSIAMITVLLSNYFSIYYF